MNIGVLEQIANIRSVWDTEPRFSDWLVSNAGLEVIQRDLGLGVENARREVRPGNYPCDVVGHLVGDEEHVVLIENQFGRTDHDHLGKLMTYAAVNRATTAVWIAEEVSDDHRSVIDWLNSNTPTHLNFYLTRIRVLRIGDSPVAPQLEVVCRPNTEVKVQQAKQDASRTDIQIWRRQLWSEIHEFLASRKPPFRLQSPGVDHWSAVSVGRSDFYLAMLLNTQRQCIAVEFVASPRGWRDEVYSQLELRRPKITEQIGSANWECKPSSKRARIFVEAPLDPRDSSNTGDIKRWFDQTLRRFYLCFEPLVKELKAPSLPAEEPEDESNA